MGREERHQGCAHSHTQKVHVEDTEGGSHQQAKQTGLGRNPICWHCAWTSGPRATRKSMCDSHPACSIVYGSPSKPIVHLLKENISAASGFWKGRADGIAKVGHESKRKTAEKLTYKWRCNSDGAKTENGFQHQGQVNLPLGRTWIRTDIWPREWEQVKTLGYWKQPEKEPMSENAE